MHSLSIYLVRRGDEVSYIAQHGKHLQSLTMTWVRPPRMRHKVAHAHEGATDQRGSALMG
jgi:hypothetical protein